MDGCPRMNREVGGLFFSTNESLDLPCSQKERKTNKHHHHTQTTETTEIKTKTKRSKKPAYATISYKQTQ